MCPQQTNPATRRPPCSSSCNPRSITGPQTPASHLHQRTLWDYLSPALTPPAPDNGTIANPVLKDTPPTISTQDSTNSTPPTTLIEIDCTLTTPVSQTAPIHGVSLFQQTTLYSDKRNDLWGDFWAIPTSARIFQIVSKNTGTINPQNLDMQAITHKLLHLGASIFVAQETNIHWDTITSYQIYHNVKVWPHKSSLRWHPARNWQRTGINQVVPCFCPLIHGRVASSILDQTLFLANGHTKNSWGKTTNMS